MLIAGGLCRMSHCCRCTCLTQHIEQAATLEQGAGSLVSAVLHLDKLHPRQAQEISGMPAIGGTLVAEDDGPGRDQLSLLEARGQIAEKTRVDLLAQGLRQVAGLGKKGSGGEIRQRREADAAVAAQHCGDE